MTLHFFANRFLESILRRLEFGPGSVDRLVLGGLDTVLARLPWRIRIRLASATDGRFGDEFAADRRRRRYFSVPHNDNAGAIRLNLAGRDPDGLVQRGTDYYRTLDELETAMLELRNLDTGQPLVEQVIRVADVVSGPALDRLPDLLVIWNRVGTVNGVGSDRVGELRDSESHLRTGDHTADAFVLARRPDKDVAASLPTLSPMDIGASLAASLAVAPVELDGRPALGLSTSLA